MDRVTRDGRSWSVGTVAEVDWIDRWTPPGVEITAAIPPVFDAYATVVLPQAAAEQRRHDSAMIAMLSAETPDQPWWLGYLDTGGEDVVFPRAPKVRLYADWPYVLVQAGPDQAAAWRRCDDECWSRFGRLPNLMFPSDRSWLVSTLWDDDWTCVGGSDALVAALLNDPELGRRARRVRVDQDSTPPGHRPT